MPTEFVPSDPPMPHDFVLAKYHVSRTTFWRWRKRGLQCLSVGSKLFVRESEIARFIAAQSAKQEGGAQ